LISHWDKRNGKVIRKLNPANLDRAKIGALVKQYGGEQMYSRWPEFEAEMNRGMGSALPAELDDFAACKITKKEDIYDLFVPNFFFGCESNDPTLNCAFAPKVNPDFLFYKLAGPREMPVIDPVFLNVYHGQTNTDARNLGQPAKVATIATVANAIYNATGAWVTELPLTPSRILAALTARDQRACT
jgi:hypothetical protein